MKTLLHIFTFLLILCSILLWVYLFAQIVIDLIFL